MASPSHPGAPSEGHAPVPPGALFEDPERVKLINMIAEKLGQTAYTEKISTFKTSYAALWLADIEKLKALVDKVPFDLYSNLRVSEMDHRIHERWSQRDKDAESRAPSAPQTPIKATPPLFPSSSAPGPSPSDLTSEPPTSTPQRQPLSLETPGSPATLKRPGESLGTPEGAKKPRLGEDVTAAEESRDELVLVAKAYKTREKSVADACKLRDKACILTKCTRDISESCHLFPFSMNDWRMHRKQMFFEGLKMFWCDKKVNEWCKAVYGDVAGTEKLQNQILLSPNAHKLHTAGWFALEPIDEDKVHDLPPKEYGVALHRVDNDHPLVSGEDFRLETHDPKTHPLPDTRLLELQWIMNRVLALRGGAEPKDLEDESDGDSDEGFDYFARPVLQSPSLPGQSSPPSSLTNTASDQPKANPVVATTDTLRHEQVEE
ncbi:hypothetical protein CNMCM7691_001390 [Aspergillus felis]|uniref:HNH nuclease domain-containing protein n=1 Tax=Aspergillus felis TaxID=1287682 RepID=A0A8H6R1M1_9EURO|nr:hypothetical protein CNMCM7691_001390 [Aspergillus felis]